MGSKFTKILNILSFGHLNRKAKKEAERQSEQKNSQLTLNTIQMPDIQKLIGALGNIDNIVSVSSTISTITIELAQIDKANFDLLKQISVKGVIKSPTNVTLLIGDCASAMKNKILEFKK